MSHALAPRPMRPKVSPQSDPRFRKVMENLQHGAAKSKKHAPASKKAGEASAAAKGPPNEKAAGAKSNQVDKLKEAPAEKPKNDSFLELLRTEIQNAMPKTLGDTDDFMKGDTPGAMKSSLKGSVGEEKDKAAGAIKGASDAKPSDSGVATKEVTPIPGEPAPGVPAVDGAQGMPLPKTNDDVSLQYSKQDTDDEMKEAHVTPRQLQKANDPRFSAVLAAKDAVAKQADAGPAQYRAGEKGVLASAASQAQARGKAGAIAMVGIRGKSNSAVLSKQDAAKAKEELERKQVTDHIEEIYTRTKASVDTKLAALETEVNAMFDAGIDAALNTMTSFVEARLDEYKDERYSGLIGKGRWVKDKLLGLPHDADVFYTQGRVVFTRTMDNLVVRVAALVELRLKQAKDEVAKGKAEIATYVQGLKPSLQSVGKNAQKEMEGRFQELEQGIDDKKNQLAQSLAQKYKEASDKADEALKKIQDANKGLVTAFVEKLGEIIKILLEFKDKLMALLKKAADVIGQIVDDPIGFLGNLISAIKLGVQQFVSNIWTHLKKGFMKWLFGNLAQAGIEIPGDLTLPSILKLVLGVLGITYERMRAKAVKLIGERAVKVLEKVFEYVKALITGGPAALWEKVKEDLGNLKEMVIDAIQSWLIETIVKQAAIKLVSLFNPAGAIVQAILAIYNVITFLIDKASQIMALIEAVINSVALIVAGNIGSAATWIENALGDTIPLVIGFLAQFIGLGGISKKIKDIITKVQNVVDKAIDKAIAKVVGFVKKLFGGGKDKGGKETEEGTVEERFKKGKAALDAYIAKGGDQEVEAAEFKAGLAPIKEKYGFTRLELVEEGAGFAIAAEMNPSAKPKVNDAKVIWKDQIIPFKPADAVDPLKFRDFKASSRGNKHLYCIDANDIEFYWTPTGRKTGRWTKIDSELQRKAEEAARNKAKADYPKFISLVKDDKNLTAPGLDVAGYIPAAGVAGSVLVGESKAFKGTESRYVQYVPPSLVGTTQPSGRTRQNPLSAITDNLQDHLNTALKTPKGKTGRELVKNVTAALKAGNLMIVFYLAGAATISDGTLDLVEKRIKAEYAEFLKLKFKMQPAEIAKVINNVTVTRVSVGV